MCLNCLIRGDGELYKSEGLGCFGWYMRLEGRVDILAGTAS